jgi:gliding motility-associated-like protein
MRRNLYSTWLVTAAIFVASLFFSTTASATHAVGTDLTFVNLGNNTYRFTLTFYRDCSGIAPPSSFTAYVSGCGNAVANFQLAQAGPPNEITPLCPTGRTNCTTGTVAGVSQYVYVGTYTFPSACASWQISTRECCRNIAINTIAGADNYWLYTTCMLNNTIPNGNNSPDFTQPPVPYVCAGQSFTYNHGVYDVDGDSLVYSLDNPLTFPVGFPNPPFPGVVVPYNAPYTPQLPLDVQAGSFTFSTTSGQTSFIAATVGQVTVVVVVVKEYRNGVLISIVRRDVQIIVINCGTNQTPQLAQATNITGGTFTPQSNSGTFRVCPGQTLSFSVTATDANAGQVVSILSNAATNFPGSVVNITNGAGNTRIFNFTWTPTASNSGVRLLAIEARDNFCDIFGFTVEGYTIIVQGVNGQANKGALCFGTPTVVNLTAQAQEVPGGQYQWSANPPVPGQPNLPTNQNITVTIRQQTTFTVRYQDNNCNGTDTMIVQAYGPVSASPAIVNNYCPTDPALQLGASYTNPAPVPPVACTATGTAVSQCSGNQTNITVGIATGNSGTSGITIPTGSATPYLGYYKSGRYQMLFTAAELTAAGVLPGLITRMQFNVTTKNSTLPYLNFNINMGCTAATSLSTATGFLTGLSNVYTSPSVTTTAGLNQYVFTNPYRWDGVSSLVVEVCNDGTSATNFANYDHVSTNTTVFTSVLYNRSDVAAGCTLAAVFASSVRANTILRNCPIIPPPAGINYTWNIVGAANGAVSNANIANPTATATAGLANGTAVRYIVTGNDGRCSSKDTVLVNINCAPTVCDVTAAVVAVTSAELTCTNTTRQLNAGPSVGDGVLTYAWSGPAGGIQGSTTAGIITVAQPGTYTVVVTNTKPGGITCTSSATIAVTQNTTVPLVAITPSTNTITCTSPFATLVVTPNAAGTQYTYNWASTAGTPSGIGSFTVPVTLAGTYTVTVTNTDNGCTASSTTAITKSANVPNAIITFPSLNLSCTNTTVTLDASTSTPLGLVDFTWSSSPLDVLATTIVNTAGTYTVTVTNPLNGCTSTAFRLVSSNTTAPVMTLTANRTTLTCTNPTANLTATLIPNHIYAWSATVASSASNTAVVNVGGVYTVTITNPANGCSTTASITIIEDKVDPLAIISPNTPAALTLTCTNTPIVLDATGSSPAVGVTFVWSGGGTGGTKSVTTPNTYTVTATITANGCTNTAQVVVTQNIVPAAPIITASAPELNCSPNATLVLTATAAGTAYAWSGGTAGATTNTRNITTAGTYTVTMTSAANGCTGTTAYVVTSNTTKPVITISAPQVLTCVTLSSSVTATGGGTYAWSGGLTPTAATNTFSGAGVSGSTTYTVTVTSATNGCVSTSSVAIVENRTLPTTAISGAASPQLTCTTISTTLTGSGADSYSWNTTQATPTISVTTPGIYTVKGTLALTGCTSVASFTVIQNNILPLPTIAADFQTLTCTNPNANLTVNGAGVNTLLWDNGTTASPRIVSADGSYTVTATTTANGCTATASIVIARNQVPPVVAIDPPSVLTCTQQTVNLTATGATTYVWDDNSTLNPRPVNAIGTYTVTGTQASNGCTATATTNVTRNITPPTITIAASLDTVLTCSQTSINLTPSGATNYAWDLTQVASQVGDVANVVVPGTYIVTATNIANGCTATKAQIILQNITPPPLALVAPVTNITCSVPQITLSASGADDFVWSNTLNANSPITSSITVVAPAQDAAGSMTYTVVGTTNSNGCSTSLQVLVTYDNRLPRPNMSVTANFLTCAIDSVSIFALGLGNDQFAWAGNYLSASGNTAITSAPGTYTVTVTSAANGCASTGTAVVQQNTTIPVVTIDPAPQITCQAPVITLSAQGTDTYLWSGPNIATQNNNTADVQAIGTYTVTGTNAVNGCKNTASVTVTQDLAPPTPIITASGVLDCSATGASVVLTAAGAQTYVWSANAQSTTGTNVTVTTGDTYTVTATLASNGCTAATVFAVTQDTVRPVLVLTTDFATVNCTNPNAILSVTPNTANYTFAWSAPINSLNPSVTVNAGATYTVTVTNTLNSCQQTASITILQDNNPPAPVITPSFPEFNCAIQSIDLAVSGNPTDTYSWENTATSNPRTVTTAPNPQTYTVTVTSAVNGCTGSASITLVPNTTAPIITINTPGILKCNNPSINLTASALPNTIPSSSFQWSNGDNGFTTTTPVTVLTPNNYCVEVTNPLNGCTASLCVPIIRDTISPPITITPPSVLNCANVAAGVQLSAMGGDTYIWSAPATTNAGGLGLANVAGVYTVTATFNGNGCTASRTITVTSDFAPPTPTITSDITELTCTATTANLTAFGADSYVWGGVATSNADFATVTQPGTYTVTATQNSNGCTAVTTIFVPQNILAPSVLAAATQLTLTCVIQTSDLSASGTGDTYVWSPSGSSASPYTIATPGTYIVTSTRATNGCTATSSITIGSNLAPPSPVGISQPTIISCNNPTTTVTAFGGDAYQWSPVLTQSGATAVIDRAGTYTVTITRNSNGCPTTTTVTVTDDLGAPTVSIAQPPVITCGSPSVPLTASAGLNSYNWVDATNTTIGITQTIAVQFAGTYTVYGTAANGCTDSEVITVTANQAAPNAILATTTNVLNCTTTNTALIASGGDVYAWTGNAQTVNGPNAVAAGPGVYIVTVTTLINGCTASASVTITQDIATQTPAITANHAELTCTNPSILLTVSGVGPFTWSGNVATTGQQIVTITQPGFYVVTATTASNGCTAVASYTVTENKEAPAPSIATSAPILNCNTQTIVLTSSVPVGAPNVTYRWSDAANTSVNVLSVTTPNTYTVTATQPSNGCTASAQQLVLQDIGQPITTISNTNVLTCTNTTTTLTANGGNSFVWSTGETSASITVAAIGTYTVTSTNAINFCTNTAEVIVNEDKIAPVPNITASNGTINCNIPTVDISVSGADTYIWTPTSETTPVITVGLGGTYTVQATKASNGCTATTSITIIQDTNLPTIVLTSNNPTITCANRRAILTAAGADIYTWAGVASSNGATANVTAQGTYTVTGTETTNGCSNTAIITIGQDLVNPTAGINPAATLTCATQSVVLTATGGGNYTWSNNVTSTNGANANVSQQGNYTVTVTTPSNGCTASVVTTVGQNIVPPAPVISTDGQLTCGNPIRTLTATSGNSFPNNYTWSTNVNSVSDSTATVLSAGVYTVVITRASNGCTASSIIAITQDIATPTASVTTDVATLTCTNPNAILTANGGDTYQWSINTVNPNNNTASASASGIYTVTASSAANGCTASATVTVNLDINVPNVSANVTNIGCNGAFSGAVDLVVANSIGTSFNWNFGPITEDISSLQVGTYTCVVTGGNGCTTSISVIVEQNSPVSATFDVTNASCNGASTGRIVPIPTGGTLPYTYEWSNSVFVGDNLNLAANVYTVTITDSRGCIGTASTIVSEPTAIVGVATQISPVRCFGQSNAQAIVNIIGGTSPYTVRWDSQEDALTAVLLNNGTHTVTITDGNQCTKTATVVITQPAVMAVSITNTTLTRCFGSADGSMTATITGGTAAATGPSAGYTTRWEGDAVAYPSLTPTNASLAAGVYSVTASDVNGCTATTSGTISSPTPVFTGVTAQTPSRCALSTDATALGVSSGGTGPVYAYRWDSGETSNPAVQLNKGTHTVTSTDTNGCSATAQFFVEGPDAITLNAQSINNITCNGLTNGSITVQIVGGTPSYLYLWSNGQTTPQAVGLPAGIHTVSVSDANGCSLTPVTFNVSEPQPLVITAMIPQSPACNAGNTGRMNVTATGGTLPYSYNWLGGGFGQPLINLSAGDYTVTVSDAKQCTASMMATITEPTPLVAVTSQVDVVCYGDKTGRIQIDNPAGGTAPYFYSLDGISFNAANYFINIPAGSYTAHVQDALGCETSLPVTITSEPQIQFTAGEDVTINLGQSVQLQASTASLVYTNVWTPAATLSDATILTPTATPTETTRYEVTLTDGSGCKAKDNVLVTVLTDRHVYIPTVFTPNGDGTNDNFGIFGGTDVTKIKVFQVFDRWGALVHEAKDFQPNDSRYAWDGHLQGTLLNAAVFVYYIQIEFKDGKTEEFKGDVTLMK